MPYASTGDDIALFQRLLIGTWKNDGSLEVDGKPLSYNVMPLPQQDNQVTRPSDGTEYGGFILKNFTFTEKIRFNGSARDGDLPEYTDPRALAVIAGAPNRGGSFTQMAHAVFYDQQVRFAEGPAAGKIVHVENGAWLHLGTRKQILGPYALDDDGPFVDGQVLRQPAYITIAKQIAVPHGNSVLALGSVDLYDGENLQPDPSGLSSNTIIPGGPIIPDAPVPYPEPVDYSTAVPASPSARRIDPMPPGVSISPQTDPYARTLNTTDDYENPNPGWALNPNYPLQKAIEIIKPTAHLHWRVTTQPVPGGEGVVTNIPFEDRKSKVTEYWADYWLLSTEREKGHHGYPTKFDYLAYSQTILMEMEVSLDHGETFGRYVFPHVTTNTVKRVGGSPSDARDATVSDLE